MCLGQEINIAESLEEDMPDGEEEELADGGVWYEGEGGEEEEETESLPDLVQLCNRCGQWHRYDHGASFAEIMNDTSRSLWLCMTCWYTVIEARRHCGRCMGCFIPQEGCWHVNILGECIGLDSDVWFCWNCWTTYGGVARWR